MTRYSKLTTKKLITLGGDTFLNIDAGVSFPDEGDESYAVGADYYFNRNISVGLGYAWADSFGDGITTVEANWFVTPKIAVSLAYSESDIGDLSSDAIALGVVARF